MSSGHKAQRTRSSVKEVEVDVVAAVVDGAVVVSATFVAVASEVVASLVALSVMPSGPKRAKKKAEAHVLCVIATWNGVIMGMNLMQRDSLCL